ncbi:hypothetical protein NP233_g9230 [Leucocoprinus birnbaumii]|uniref:Aminoglycoside phosphotransferase domain-containing protein n=1 Tax=Leucocoprinus birnbaumii TaxID=56174 RepID=A0AAD5VL39_9AGAR|nr:hypothetical protein NP233_g9230 [Leucocoprinus birnbaumii]
MAGSEVLGITTSSSNIDPTTAAPAPPQITREQAEAVVRKVLPGHDKSTVRKITGVRSKGYRCVFLSTFLSTITPHLTAQSASSHTVQFTNSFTECTMVYIIDLIRSTDPSVEDNPSDLHTASDKSECACFLTITHSTTHSLGEYTPNSLPVINNLLNSIRTKTEIPLTESILDTSLSLIPYHFLLSGTTTSTSERMISVADARKLGLLSEKANQLVDLELGKFLGQLHTNVQNDWFGAPQLQEPTDPSYTWQETFTDLFERLISHFESGDVKIDFDLPYERIRLSYSRAIGFSLFDDVEVPSLVWLTGSEEDVFISKPTDPDGLWYFEVCAILPVATHAIWGDPLLESFFVPPNPTKAMAEGYIGAGGGALTIYPRQNTKRIWYDLFLALLVLYEIRNLGDADEIKERRAWCEKAILDSVDALKDAPNY